MCSSIAIDLGSVRAGCCYVTVECWHELRSWPAASQCMWHHAWWGLRSALCADSVGVEWIVLEAVASQNESCCCGWWQHHVHCCRCRRLWELLAPVNGLSSVAFDLECQGGGALSLASTLHFIVVLVSDGVG